MSFLALHGIWVFEEEFSAWLLVSNKVLVLQLPSFCVFSCNCSTGRIFKLLRTLKYFLKGRGKGKTVVFIFQALIEIFLHLDFHGMEFPRKDMRISLRNPKEMGNHILLRIKGEKISSNVSFLHKPVKRLRDLLAKHFRTPWPFMSYLKIRFLKVLWLVYSHFLFTDFFCIVTFACLWLEKRQKILLVAFFIVYLGWLCTLCSFWERFPVKHVTYILNPIHSVWKSQKKSHLILWAKRATFP